MRRMTCFRCHNFYLVPSGEGSEDHGQQLCPDCHAKAKRQQAERCSAKGGRESPVDPERRVPLERRMPPRGAYKGLTWRQMYGRGKTNS